MQIVSNEIFTIYFSPFSAHAIEVEGVLYPTVEHAYHCARYTDEEVRTKIREQRSPLKAWEVSQEYKSKQIPEFKDKEYKKDVVRELFRLKTEQHAEVRDALSNTGEKRIVKHIVAGPRGDGFWDDGEDGSGENWMGRIWMEVREGLL
jgi:ribA/ribD-fused uncharacterized protein